MAEASAASEAIVTSLMRDECPEMPTSEESVNGVMARESAVSGRLRTSAVLRIEAASFGAGEALGSSLWAGFKDDGWLLDDEELQCLVFGV